LVRNIRVFGIEEGVSDILLNGIVDPCLARKMSFVTEEQGAFFGDLLCSVQSFGQPSDAVYPYFNNGDIRGQYASAREVF